MKEEIRLNESGEDERERATTRSHRKHWREE